MIWIQRGLGKILCFLLSFACSCSLPTSMALSMCSTKLVHLTFPLWSCSPGLGQAAVWCWHPEYIPCSLSCSSAWWHLHSIGCSRAEALGSTQEPLSTQTCPCAFPPCVPVLPWPTSAGTFHMKEAHSELWLVLSRPWETQITLDFNFLMSESAFLPCWTAGCSSEMPFALQIGGIDLPQKH